MAKFVYRLQGFLNLKEKIEDQKRLEYGRAITELEEEKNKKRVLLEKKEACILGMREGINKRVEPDYIQRSNRYISLLDKMIIKQETAIRLAERRAEKKRLELVGAMTERKTLDTLKDKSYDDFLVEEKRAEQKITDEIVSYRYNIR